MDADVPFYFPPRRFPYILLVPERNGKLVLLLSNITTASAFGNCREIRWRCWRSAPSKNCWVVEESAEGRAEKRNTTIINNFDFHLKIRRVPNRNCFSRKKFFCSNSRKCVINENKIIDKKKRSSQTFLPFTRVVKMEKLRSLVKRITLGGGREKWKENLWLLNKIP